MAAEAAAAAAEAAAAALESGAAAEIIAEAEAITAGAAASEAAAGEAVAAALADLVAIAGLFVAVGTLMLFRYVINHTLAKLNFSLFGVGVNIGSDIAGSLGGWIQDAISALEGKATLLEQAVAKSLHHLATAALVLAADVFHAIRYLWEHGIMRQVRTVTNPIHKAVQDVTQLAHLIRADLGHDYWALRAFATAAATAEYHHAASDANAAIATVADDVAKLRATVKANNLAAQSYASQAVNQLNSVADIVFGNTLGLVYDVQSAIYEAESAAATVAEKQAARDLAVAKTAFDESLNKVRAIAVTGEEDVKTIVGKLTPLQAAAIIASVPVLSTLMNQLLSDTGLENKDCRSKVKNVCQSDSQLWGDLLATVTTVIAVSDWKTMAELVGDAVHAVAPVLKTIAQRP